MSEKAEERVGRSPSEEIPESADRVTPHVDSVAERVLRVAETSEARGDAVVAYLCAWVAVSRLVTVIAWRSGVRPQFSLRQNGTLRTRKEGGYKVPELTPAREDHQWRAALEALLPAEARRLLVHPNVRALATRVPTLDGKRVLKDAYGQRPSGVLDVALTRDIRYPVWHTVALAAPAEVGPETGGSDVAETLWQLGVLLRTIQSNLLAEGQDADAELAQLGLPLVRLLAAGLLRALDR
ncbi:MAG: hypothetical protein JXC32_07135 [Anaerolineae bacterium]|nr:hypothetical protein [Anaerolineae bacterium]